MISRSPMPQATLPVQQEEPLGTYMLEDDQDLYGNAFLQDRFRQHEARQQQAAPKPQQAAKRQQEARQQQAPGKASQQAPKQAPNPAPAQAAAPKQQTASAPKQAAKAAPKPAVISSTVAGWEGVVPDADGQTAPSAAATAMVAAIESNRAGIDVRNMRKRKKGYKYVAWYDDKKKSQDYRTWLKTAVPTGVDLKNPKDKAQWELFKDTAKSEGDPSSMNTWDNQNVTMGAGFSAAGALQGVLKRLFAKAPSARQRYYDAGILLHKGQFVVVDGDRKVQLRGNAGEKIIQRDQRLISLMIDVTQSDQQDGGKSLRQHNLDAQFEEFRRRAGRLPGFAYAWPRLSRAVAGHANHWLPGVFRWKRFKDTGGDLTKIVAVMARQYCRWRKRPYATRRIHSLVKLWGGAKAFAAPREVERFDDSHVYIAASRSRKGGKPKKYYVFDKP